MTRAPHRPVALSAWRPLRSLREDNSGSRLTPRRKGAKKLLKGSTPLGDFVPLRENFFEKRAEKPNLSRLGVNLSRQRRDRDFGSKLVALRREMGRLVTRKA